MVPLFVFPRVRSRLSFILLSPQQANDLFHFVRVVHGGVVELEELRAVEHVVVSQQFMTASRLASRFVSTCVADQTWSVARLSS